MNCHGFNFQKANSSNNFALATRSARGVAESSAPKEGVGNAGCPLHPQPRARLALVKMHTSKRVHRNRPAFPHAMVLTVSFVLSPVTGLFCHRHQRIKVLSKPGRADLTSANLTPEPLNGYKGFVDGLSVLRGPWLRPLRAAAMTVLLQNAENFGSAPSVASIADFD